MGSQELCLLSSAGLGVYGLRGTLAGCGRLGNEGFPWWYTSNTRLSFLSIQLTASKLLTRNRLDVIDSCAGGPQSAVGLGQLGLVRSSAADAGCKVPCKARLWLERDLNSQSYAQGC